MSGEFVREGSARPAVTQDVKSSLAPPTPMLSTAVSAPSPSAVPLPTGLGAPVKQLSGSSDSSGPPSASGPLVAPSSVPPPISFSAQLPSSAVVPPGQLVLSPTLSRSSSSASVASNGGAAASKKSSLNPNAKVLLSSSISLLLFALRSMLVHEPLGFLLKIFSSEHKARQEYLGCSDWWIELQTVT